MSSTIALVTGAGSGIGKAIALGFAAQGDRVIAADIDEAAAAATAQEYPQRITALPVDVADRSRVDALRERAHAEIGVPNVLVNAAGWDRTDQFLNATTEFAEKVVAGGSSTWPVTPAASAAQAKPSTPAPRAASSR